MPQLVKGGKYVFGWSIISEDGGVLIPEEARREYKLNPEETVILIPGSRISGGFSIARKSLLEQSRLSAILTQDSYSDVYSDEGRKTVGANGRILYWTNMQDNGQLSLPTHVLESYGVKAGDYLLVIRGSNIGVGMAAKGPLVEEAKKHPEISVFEPGKV
jgi:bifunctional DNA-binding transcriptional regulator/antitoxin component of YhaV-PrlF toxin-antitoxin module